MAKKPPVEQDDQQESTGKQKPPKKPVNTLLWRILLLPSLLILALAVALYITRPLRDAFLSGSAVNSYLVFGTIAAWAPWLWKIGLSCILFALWLIVAIARTVARGEWRYWQRLLGLLALTGGTALLLYTGLPDMGIADARDCGSTALNGHSYHLLAQNIPQPPNVVVRMMIFDCDVTGNSCTRVKADDLQYVPGDRVPALVLLRIKTDGPLVVTQSNTAAEDLQTYRPQ